MKRIILLTIAILTVATPAHAGPQDVANDIAREMMSPYCDGVTLHDCPSEASHDLRRRIAGWAEEGMTEDEIWQRLEAEFGSGIRARPSTDGSGLFAWLLPIGATTAGIALAAMLALRWSRRRSPEPDAPTNVSNEQRRRLEGELATLRERQG